MAWKLGLSVYDGDDLHEQIDLGEREDKAEIAAMAMLVMVTLKAEMGYEFSGEEWARITTMAPDEISLMSNLCPQCGEDIGNVWTEDDERICQHCEYPIEGRVGL